MSQFSPSRHFLHSWQCRSNAPAIIARVASVFGIKDAACIGHSGGSMCFRIGPTNRLRHHSASRSSRILRKIYKPILMTSCALTSVIALPVRYAAPKESVRLGTNGASGRATKIPVAIEYERPAVRWDHFVHVAGDVS